MSLTIRQHCLLYGIRPSSNFHTFDGHRRFQELITHKKNTSSSPGRGQSLREPALLLFLAFVSVVSFQTQVKAGLRRNLDKTKTGSFLSRSRPLAREQPCSHFIAGSSVQVQEMHENSSTRQKSMDINDKFKKPLRVRCRDPGFPCWENDFPVVGNGTGRLGCGWDVQLGQF